MADLIIRPLHVGTVGRDKAIFTYLRNMGVQIEVPVLAWYVEGNGRRILVDTGGHDPNEVQMHAPYRREPAQDPVTALAAIGIAPAEIDTIILTHLHWDHASNTHRFPKARVLVQREELRYAASSLPPHRWAYRVHPPLSSHWDRYEAIDGDLEVADGVSVHLTPGHTPGLQGVAVRAASRVYYIASDNVVSHPQNRLLRADAHRLSPFAGKWQLAKGDPLRYRCRHSDQLGLPPHTEGEPPCRPYATMVPGSSGFAS